ncbi:MAG: hypothetical protein Fur0010_22790 [Bdellovibrio sp.]
MLVYSKTLSSFQARLKKRAFFLLSQECKIQTLRERFKIGAYSFPLNIVTFEDPKLYGFFSTHLYQVGINRKLMYEARDVVIDNILRHELAHYLCFIKFGRTVDDHGSEYRDLCRSFNWGEEVFSAKMNLEYENELAKNSDHQKIVEKVKKLLQLSESDNPHEAETATAKANQLILEHNLSHLGREKLEDDELVYLKRSLESKKFNAKIQALAHVMDEFYVKAILSRGPDKTYLELIGDKDNVEMADYILHFLDNEFERQWKIMKENHPNLKGQRAKNSFMAGLSKGLIEKIKRERSTVVSSKDLMVMSIKREEQMQLVYPTLSMVGSGRHIDGSAHSLGKSAGQNININKGIEARPGQKLLR